MGCQSERGSILNLFKVCCQCKEKKAITEFFKDKKRKDGKYPYCKKCTLEHSRRYRAKPGVKEKTNEGRRKLGQRKPGRHWKEYGINMTAEEYNQKFLEQKGQCVLCGIHQSQLSKRLCVDHDHDTGQCRGLVCVPCNTLIGIIENKSDMLKKIDKYLDFWNRRKVENGLSV